MSLPEKICGQCGVENTSESRLIIEICGHRKCRQCFIREDNCCIQCEVQNRNNVTQIQEKTIELNVGQDDPKDSNLITNNVILQPNKKREEKSKHKCSECVKVFSKPSYLKYHLETHLPYKYNCSYCHKTFNNRLVLKNHENLHTTKSTPCLYCGKVLSSKTSLSTHVSRKHTHILEHKCSHCSKAYPSKSALNQHLLKHENKKYYCTQCGKSYHRNSTLTSHLKRHNKTQTYQCYKCKKNFTDANSCKRHEKRHKDSFKFRCKHCEIITLRKDNMLRHIRNFHVNFTYQESVDIIKPLLTNVSNIHSRELESRMLLKTVENSTVIKCIGNVEPVIIPPISTGNESNIPALSSNLDKSTDNCKRYQGINYTKLNIDLYRRILEDGANFHGSVKLLLTDNRESNVKRELVRKPAPLHWRKNFKNNYELTEY